MFVNGSGRDTDCVLCNINYFIQNIVSIDLFTVQAVLNLKLDDCVLKGPKILLFNIIMYVHLS